MEVLIVPCTNEKVWDRKPALGPVAAKDAYTKPIFRTWRKWAETSGSPWFILSTKYGLIAPDTLITAYNVPVSAAIGNRAFIAVLRKQGETAGLSRFNKVVLPDWERFRPLVKAAVGRGRAACVLRKVAYR